MLGPTPVAEWREAISDPVHRSRSVNCLHPHFSVHLLKFSPAPPPPSRFVETIMQSAAQGTFFLNTFADIARQRVSHGQSHSDRDRDRPTERALVTAICQEIFHVSFLWWAAARCNVVAHPITYPLFLCSEISRQTYRKTGRDLLASIVEVHPFVVSEILLQLNEHLASLGKV